MAVNLTPLHDRVIVRRIEEKESVKGGIIGAAAGGILGGVIGNNVDKKRIYIEAIRDIAEGDELTYDYGITLDEPHTARLKKIWACRCGAKACTGTMLKPKR